MGFLDKLKGHKKDDSVKSFDDVAERKGKRSSSMTRKSGDKSRNTRSEAVPELPAHNAPVIATSGAGTSAGTTHAAATYPVDGATTVSEQRETSRTTASDALSTTAAKDGKIGEQSVDGLSRDLAQTNLSTVQGGGSNLHVASSFEPTYAAGKHDPKNLSQTPFSREAFHAQFGGGVDTTEYEQTLKAAVLQEVVKPHLREEVHPIFHREHHVIHHQTRIQPVLEQVLLPAKHYILIDGQKHEITGEAVMNHVVKSRDWIPMSGAKPKVVVHQYVENEPLVGPVTNVGASLINKDVMLEHQRMINTSYEQRAVGETHSIPTGVITRVNYMPGQVPVSTERGVGSSTLAESAVAGTSHGHHNHSSSHASAHNQSGARVPVDDAIERTSARLPDQRASLSAQ